MDAQSSIYPARGPLSADGNTGSTKMVSMKHLGIALSLVILVACSQRADLDDFIEGAGAVAIGMTESEVSKALNAQSEARKGNEVAWRLDKRSHPGSASGSFVNGYLSGIQFTADLSAPAPPRIDKAAADALSNKETALRAISHKLTIAEVEAAAGGRGRRASWVLTMGQGNTIRSISIWVWEINPGGKLLIVSEERGEAGQPYVRSMGQ
jgi:hypothetical protein